MLSFQTTISISFVYTQQRTMHAQHSTDDTDEIKREIRIKYEIVEQKQQKRSVPNKRLTKPHLYGIFFHVVVYSIINIVLQSQR